MACKDCQECERFTIGVPGMDNDVEMCAEDLSLDGIERCPWPSKRVVKGKIIERKHCLCDQEIMVEHNSDNSCRSDKIRFFYQEIRNTGWNIFRCKNCHRVVEYSELKD